MTEKQIVKTKTTRQKAAEAGAKVPEDRAAKAEATGEAVDVTVFGVELSIERDVVDDYEAIELLAQNVPTRMFSLIAGDREEEIRDALREPSGKLRASKILSFVLEVLQAVGAGK